MVTGVMKKRYLSKKGKDEIDERNSDNLLFSKENHSEGNGSVIGLSSDIENKGGSWKIDKRNSQVLENNESNGLDSRKSSMKNTGEVIDSDFCSKRDSILRRCYLINNKLKEELFSQKLDELVDNGE